MNDQNYLRMSNPPSAVTSPPHGSEEVARPSTVHASKLAGLPRIRAMTKRALTQQWPTRRLPLCPPAHGALVPMGVLGGNGLLPVRPKDTVLVLFLPDDFEPHLETLAARAPEVRTHELVSLRKRETYLSLSVPAAAKAGQTARPSLPLTVWVRVQDIMDEYMDHSTSSGRMPVVLVSSNQAALAYWTFDEAQTTRVDSSLGACAQWVPRCSPDEKQRAEDKAERYGERPWLFMRYELTNLGRRFAVNWAPVCTMRGEQVEPYCLEP